MEDTSKDKIEKYKKQHNYKKKLYVGFTILACVIAVGTVWGLVQPANTMSGELICGFEEHTHTEDCYEQQLICEQEENENHTHTEECWTSSIVCPLMEHTHNESCYDVNEVEELPSEEPEQELPQQIPEENKESTSKEQLSETEKQVVEQLRKEIPADYTEMRTAQFSEEGTVYLFAQPEVLSEEIQLKVEWLDNTNPLFAQAEQRVQVEEIRYDYFNAMDISLVDAQGKEIEPSAPVYVSIDFGSLISEEVDPKSIQIQHHKEVREEMGDELLENQSEDVSKEPKIVLESMMEDEESVFMQNAATQSYIATFPTESFSIYTITSSGWPNLKIKIECVDEFGHEVYGEDKPNDIVLDHAHKPEASFGKMFMSDEHDPISGYKYDGKAYFMKDGKYDRQIYGIRREGNKWYYYTKDRDRNSKVEFPNQPDFEKKGEQDPPDFIRVVYRKVTDIHVKYMDDEGVFGEKEIPLSQEDSPNGKNPGVIEYVGTELEIGNTDVMPKSNTYFYRGKAYVGEPKYENQVVKVIRKDRKPYGVSLEGKEILISEQEPLKLMYRKINTTAPEQVTMVPLREKGLKINLFNYNTRDTSKSINNGKKLKFKPQGNSSEPYNNWTGKDGGIYQNIVGDTLVDGYPTVQGESLDYLFDPEKCKQQLETGQVKNVYEDLDGLFWQDKDGYYHYDSMTNFATVVPENGTPEKHSQGKDFIVYRQPVLPTVNGTGDNAKFMPFDTYANANKPKPNNQPADKEYHFGMTMEAEFTMPPGGKVPDAEGGHTGLRDMIFEFNGDDDVWLFIDDKLVLDLGGIHDRYGGKINFRTGEVVTNSPPTPHSGRYQKNLYNIDPTGMTDEQLKIAREKAGFGKFSHHKFKFFYLERGEGASNCEIRFNLVPVQHGLVVGKRLPEATMQDVATDHMWYQFQAGTEFKGERKALANATFRRIKWKPGAHPITGGQDVGIGQTDEEGRFWLRAGERADFAGAIDLKKTGITDKEKINIYVREILPDGSPTPIAWSGKEEAPGTHMEVPNPEGNVINKLVPPLYDYNGPEMKVNLHTDKTKEKVTERAIPGTSEKAYEVTVNTGMKNEFNWVDFENDIGTLAGLNITKYAKKGDGKPIEKVPFAIKVELWDTKDQTWTPLPEGTDYWILTGRELQPGEKLPEDQKQQIKKTDNGLISIEHNQSIHMHVLPGTKYRVSEILNTEDKVAYTTTYEGRSTVASDEFINTQNQNIENKTGIQANSQHYITINNTGDPVIMPKGSFVLMKKTKGIVPPNTKFQFQMQIQEYTNSEKKLSCKATYYGTPSGARAQGREETIVFEPDANGQYEENIFLYPGEIVVIEDLPVGKKLQVQEIFGETQSGDYKVSFQEDGKEVVQENKIVTSAIDSKRVVKVTCLNESNLKEDSELSISKEVKRTDRPDGSPLPEEKERAFPFQVTIQKPGTVSLEEVPFKKVLANGEVNYSKLAFKPSGEDYVADLELKHGEKVVISELPAGVQVLVQEVEHAGYAVSMNGISGDRITVDLGYNTGTPYEVKCINMTGVQLPETGGHGVLAYFLAGVIMMLSALGFFVWSWRQKI